MPPPLPSTSEESAPERTWGALRAVQPLEPVPPGTAAEPTGARGARLPLRPSRPGEPERPIPAQRTALTLERGGGVKMSRRGSGGEQSTMCESQRLSPALFDSQLCSARLWSA